MLVPLPPLEAYRHDIARLDGQPFGPDDGRWLAAASLLQRFTESTGADRRDIGAQLASHLAIETELTFCRAALQFGREIEEGGALHLAMSWLTLVESTIPDDRTVDLGRVRGARARVARRLGDVEASRTLYGEVEQLGESRAEPELTARAWLGYGVIAVERGNYPEARRWYEAAALVADDTGCIEEACQAHSGLMGVCAKMGDAEAAILEGWTAYRIMANDGERASELLSNLSQFLYEQGQFATALRGFGAVVSQSTQPRILLGALGGAALAGAALGDPAIVNAAAIRIERLTRTAWSHPVALALVELSDAFTVLGDSMRSAEYRQRALVLAEANAHYELIYRAAENPPAQPLAVDLAQLGSTVLQVIEEIESFQPPADLSLVG